MKKWMKAISVMFALIMAFCVAGGVSVRADLDKRVSSIRVEYKGEPVPYEETIDPSDFRVRVVYSDGSSEYLSVGDFDISPSRMESQRSQRVTVSVVDSDRRVRSASVTINCAEPELVSIDARYIGNDLLVNGEISKKDVTVEAYYTDGSYKYVDDWTFASYRLKEGSNTITVYYREDGIREADTFTVYAYEGELSYITAYYNGNAVTVGSKVDTSKINVTGVYSERGYGNITQALSGWSLADYTIQEGSNTLTVVYRENGQQFTDTITVRGVASTTTTTANTVVSTSSRSGQWVQSGALWKFQLSNNSYLTNSWVQSAETAKWYYVGADGNMATDKWVQINGKWYFVNHDGTMATGWKQVSGKWYYLDETDGDMVTGWKYDKEKWYYLTPGSGEMAISRWIDNWYVNEEGVWSQTR